jgi:hypothetical protein
MAVLEIRPERMSVRVRGILSRMRPVCLVVAGLWISTLAGPVPARADLVFLASGRTLSVRAVRLDGDQAVLALRGGGEVVCASRLIERVTPDEVPYPEPPAPADLRPGAAVPPFADLIVALAARHRVDEELVRAVVEVESAYLPTARSRRGAMGLMQLMPATARQYAVDDPFDPGKNLEAGIRHLRSLLDRYEVRLALAAYNAGEGAVQRFGGMPPYPETRDYVARVLARVGSTGTRGGASPASRPASPASGRVRS